MDNQLEGGIIEVNNGGQVKAPSLTVKDGFEWINSPMKDHTPKISPSDIKGSERLNRNKVIEVNSQIMSNEEKEENNITNIKEEEMEDNEAQGIQKNPQRQSKK